MATTKKAPAKKTTAKKAPTKAPVKKTAAAKATTKKAASRAAAKPVARKATTTRRSSTKKQATANIRSFRVDRGPQPSFTSFRVTKQTVYWIFLVAFIIFVQLWILKLQFEVVTLLDAQQATLEAGQ